jgi:hypothetical protein
LEAKTIRKIAGKARRFFERLERQGRQTLRAFIRESSSHLGSRGSLGS